MGLICFNWVGLYKGKGNKGFICEGEGFLEFIINWGYPFGLKNENDPTDKQVRKIKSGNQQGLNFSNFSSKRNNKYSFPQIMSSHTNSASKIYIDEISSKNNLALDNQDMNFDLDVVSGSYKVSESESYILY